MTGNWMIGLKLLMGEVEKEAVTGKKMNVCLGYRRVNELNSSHEGITVVQTGIAIISPPFSVRCWGQEVERRSWPSGRGLGCCCRTGDGLLVSTPWKRVISPGSRGGCPSGHDGTWTWGECECSSGEC